MIRTILIVFLFVFNCGKAFSAENIVIDTQNGNLFKNIISDTFLLLDSGLKRIISKDLATVANESRFTIQVNSWMPRPNPKTKIENICVNIDSKNYKKSFAQLVEPVVELACTSKEYDPLNERMSKCINDLFKYPILETIKIRYDYQTNINIDQNIANLSNLSDRVRYHQIICTLADIMNGAYEKVSKKNVTKSVNFTKYPLDLVAPTVAKAKNFSKKDQILISNEKADLESQINQKRMECHDSKPGSNDYCYKKKYELEGLLDELERNPEYYFKQKPVREAKTEAKVRAAQGQNTDNNSAQSKNQKQQYFMTNGGMLNQPPGSSFATTTKGETYFKPEGSAFSYGTGANAGKNCFHYGAFADCN